MDSWCQSQLPVLGTAENTKIFCMDYAYMSDEPLKKKDELVKLHGSVFWTIASLVMSNCVLN